MLKNIKKYNTLHVQKLRDLYYKILKLKLLNYKLSNDLDVQISNALSAYIVKFLKEESLEDIVDNMNVVLEIVGDDVFQEKLLKRIRKKGTEDSTTGQVQAG